jgi:hypothetical protein
VRGVGADAAFEDRGVLYGRGQEEDSVAASRRGSGERCTSADCNRVASHSQHFVDPRFARLACPRRRVQHDYDHEPRHSHAVHAFTRPTRPET